VSSLLQVGGLLLVVAALTNVCPEYAGSRSLLLHAVVVGCVAAAAVVGCVDEGSLINQAHNDINWFALSCVAGCTQLAGRAWAQQQGRPLPCLNLCDCFDTCLCSLDEFVTVCLITFHDVLLMLAACVVRV